MFTPCTVSSFKNSKSMHALMTFTNGVVRCDPFLNFLIVIRAQPSQVNRVSQRCMCGMGEEGLINRLISIDKYLLLTTLLMSSGCTKPDEVIIYRFLN